MKKYPTVTVAIVTYNSEKTLEIVLSSVRKQKYPKKNVEILIIDGGSTDTTLNIAKKFNTTIIKNPKVDFVNGKYLAYKKAKGQYLMLLDSDEEIENTNSLKLKVEAFKRDENIKVVTSSGYKSPVKYPKIIAYINEYGDPFSFYMYRSSRDSKFFLKEFKSKYSVVKENKNCVVFDFSREKNAPFLELISMGVMVDLPYIRKSFANVFKKPFAHNHLFYLINSNKNFLAITKKDAIIHYSVNSNMKYLKKITSRVKNNIFETRMGVAGFSGREKYYSSEYKIKKFLFLPYSFSLVLPIFDSVYLTVKHNNIIYMTHFMLCFYTAVSIVYFLCLKSIGRKPNLVGYAAK